MSYLSRSAFGLAAAMIIVSCSESLPPRDDPSQFFGGKLTARYLYSATENNLLFVLTLRNNYDETLQGYVNVNGTITIEWLEVERRAAFDFRRTVVLTSSDLSYARKFDRVTNILTIDPGDSVQLRYMWNWKTNDSTDVRNQFRYRLDQSCFLLEGIYRKISEKQPFSVRCQIRLFERSAITYIRPVDLKFCYIDRYVRPCSKCSPPFQCPEIPPERACDF